jgi:outer membrane protein assembly factor BamB
MRKEWLIYGGMWTAAIVAMVAIYFSQETGRPTSVSAAGDGAPVRSAQEGPAGLPPREATSAQAPFPEGPPRQYRGGPRHTGRSSFAGPGRAERYWAFETQGHVVGQPAVGDDGTVYVGSRDHHVYALTPTGGVVWRRDLGADVYASPAIHGGRLYVGSDANFFFILDAHTGDVIVHLRTEGDVDTGIAVGSDGTAYFGAGPELWAVAQDGTVRFRFVAEDKIFSAPALDDDGTIYVGTQDDHLYALTPEGQLRWSFQARNDIDSGPVVGDDGTVYFGSDDHFVYALDRNGQRLWSADVGGYVRTPVALGLDGNVLVPVFGPHARLVSLDARTGEEQWEFSVSRTDSNELGVGSSPLVDRDGNIYFGADDDYLYAIDRRGRMRWIYPTEGNVDGDPVLAADGTLLVGSDDRHLHALRADPAASAETDAGGSPEDAGPEPALDAQPVGSAPPR